jgi:2-polyprenyl-3-methyl-5-hydroxy-6-metoxy-1,4-benzoquinol methylase
LVKSIIGKLLAKGKNMSSQAFEKKIDSRHTGLVDSVKNGWFLQQSDELFRGFKLNSDDVLLDVGAGAGAVSHFAAQRQCKVTYTDIDSDAIDQLKQRFSIDGFGDNTTGVVSDSDPLPFDSCSYNKIVCLEVLEHTVNPQSCMNELFRVGKPGAKYLLSVPGELGENFQKSYAPEVYFSEPNHLNIFSKSNFEKIVESAGLTIDNYETTGFYWFLWMSLYWIDQKQKGVELTGAALDKVEAPYSPLLDSWSTLWHEVLKNPHSEAMRRHLDDLLPKSQIIIATKPVF